MGDPDIKTSRTYSVLRQKIFLTVTNISSQLKWYVDYSQKTLGFEYAKSLGIYNKIFFVGLKF